MTERDKYAGHEQPTEVTEDTVFDSYDRSFDAQEDARAAVYVAELEAERDRLLAQRDALAEAAKNLLAMAGLYFPTNLAANAARNDMRAALSTVTEDKNDER